MGLRVSSSGRDRRNAYKGFSKEVGGGGSFPRGLDVDAETREHDQERARHSSRELQREGMRRRGREAQGTAASVAGGQEGRVWLQVGVTARVVCAEAVGGGGRERGRGRK